MTSGVSSSAKSHFFRPYRSFGAIVLKVKSAKFHERRNKTVVLYKNKQTNKHSSSYINIPQMFKKNCLNGEMLLTIK